MKKIKNSGLFWVLIITFIIFCCMLAPYWLNNLPFEYGGDLKPTYFPYYTEFRNLMKEFVRGNGFPFYSWNLFLGNNFWSSKSFYILGDIYYYISLLFNTHFYNIFTIQTFLKLMISASTFYWLAKTYNFSKKSSVIVSICFAFSSWIMFFLGQPMFISAYSFIPLFFIGIEKYLKYNKRTVFILSVTLILFTNYYMFFPLSFFAPFYFWARYYAINHSFRGWLLSALKLIGYYIIGVMTTCILILPAFIYILQNDRVGTFYFALNFDQLEIYFHQIQALFIPSQNIIYHSYNIFETGSHVTRELCLWAGSITALLLPQILTDKDKYFKKSMICIYVFFILMLVIPSGNMMLMGFSSPSFRWTFIIIVVNLLVAGRYLSDIDKVNFKNLKISVIVIVIICLCNMPLFLLITNQLSIFWDNIGLFLLSLFSALIFVVLYFVLKSKSKYRTLIILSITILEILCFNVKLIGFDRRNENSTWKFIDSATSVLGSSPNELNNYLDGLDEVNYSSYYRVYIPHDSLYWSYSHNHNLHYGLKGLMTYDSTYAPSFNDMKMIAPSVKDFDSEWIFNIKDEALVDFLNVKYAVVVDPSELPHDNFKLLVDDYRGSLLIYENLNYKPVGNTYNKVIDYDTMLNNNYDLDLLNNTVIAHESDLEEIETLIGNNVYSLENIDYRNNYFYGNITTDENGFMVLTIPYDAGWNVEVNGEKQKIFNVNGGMMGIPVQKGFNEIVMSFVPVGFKVGTVISLIGLLGTIIIVIFDMKKWRK